MKFLELLESSNIVEILLTASITTIFWLLSMIIVLLAIYFIKRRNTIEQQIDNNQIIDNEYVNETEQIEYNPENNINLVVDLMEQQFILYVRNNNIQFNEFILLKTFLYACCEVEFGEYVFIYRVINTLCSAVGKSIRIEFNELSWIVICNDNPLFVHEYDPTSVQRFKDTIRFYDNESSSILEHNYREYILSEFHLVRYTLN